MHEKLRQVWIRVRGEREAHAAVSSACLSLLCPVASVSPETTSPVQSLLHRDDIHAVFLQQDGKVACVPLSLRRGLPPAFAATQATLSASSGAAGHAVPAAEYSIGTQLAAALRDAAQMVESAPSLIQRTADDLVRDFMAERLPPAPKDVRASGAPPTLDTCVCCRSEVCRPPWRSLPRCIRNGPCARRLLTFATPQELFQEGA